MLSRRTFFFLWGRDFGRGGRSALNPFGSRALTFYPVNRLQIFPVRTLSEVRLLSPNRSSPSRIAQEDGIYFDCWSGSGCGCLPGELLPSKPTYLSGVVSLTVDSSGPRRSCRLPSVSGRRQRRWQGLLQGVSGISC